MTASICTSTTVLGSPIYFNLSGNVDSSLGCAPTLTIYNDSSCNTTFETLSCSPNITLGHTCCTGVSFSYSAYVGSCRTASSPVPAPIIAPPSPNASPPMVPAPAPVFVPVAAPVAAPVAPQVAPAPIPASLPPTACAGTNPNASIFYCGPTGWTTNTTVVSPTITIDSNVTIVGNLTTTTIVIDGPYSSVSVSGCIALNGSLQLVLTQQDLNDIAGSHGKTTTLLSQNSSCENPLDGVSVVASYPQSCQKATVTNVNSGNLATLSVLIGVDSSGCNNNGSVWWYILVGVLGGVILLCVLFIVLVATIPGLRRRVSPVICCYKRRAASKTINRASI